MKSFDEQWWCEVEDGFEVYRFSQALACTLVEKFHEFKCLSTWIIRIWKFLIGKFLKVRVGRF